MSSTAENNKRIAKNTLLLYVRMLFTIIVGLYTSRVVLNTLGVNDYGIYNVVGGIVAMLAFLNSAMTAASQRFISFELGTKNYQRLKEVFSTSVTIHLIIAGIIFIISETIGLWFLNTHMNISSDRMEAANWVYQCSILTFMVTVISVPYNACIVAHERMKAFAYISIIEVGLKLIIVYLLLVFSTDKLITYAILIFSVSVIIRVIYGIYCKKNFEECIYRFSVKRALWKQMLSFVGWGMLANFGVSLRLQGANILLNIFFNPAVNAARGIAMQVNGIVINFSNNFLMALNPQITKEYANGNIDRTITLIYAGSRYSFYLLSIISLPMIVSIDYLLKLWLGIVPEYTNIFLKLTIVAALIDTMTYPMVTATYATGVLRRITIIISLLNILELPLVYFILKLGGAAYMSMYPTIAIALINLLTRFFLLKRIITGLNAKHFILKILIPNIFITGFAYFISIVIKFYILSENTFIDFILSATISVIVLIVLIYLLGISSKERKFINKRIKNIFKH